MPARGRSGLLTALLSLAVACGSGDAARSPAAAPEGSPTRAAQTDPPCVGVAEPDPAVLLPMLEAHHFEALDAALREAQTLFETNKACEVRLWRGLNVFHGTDESLAPHLDAWVAAMPDAWTARSARGAHWAAIGFERRGIRLAHETPAEAFAAMNEAFARAMPDLLRAIELEPRHLPPYFRAIGIESASGDAARRDRLLAAAIAADPLSYSFRDAVMHWYTPMWGGSVEALHRIADEAQSQRSENPRLARLPATALAFEGHDRMRGGDYEAAAKLYDEALAIFASPDFTFTIIRYHRKHGRHERVIRAATRYLEFQGDDAWALTYRGLAYWETGNRERAGADLVRAAELAPRDAWVQAQHAWVVEATQGGAAAVPLYERALALDPGDAWVAKRLAASLQATPERRAEAAPVLRRLTESAPGDAGIWLAYGTLLHELGDAEARPALERYLALADPGDPKTQGRKNAVQQMLVATGTGGATKTGGGSEVAANALPALARVTALVEARRASPVKAETR